MGKASQTIQQDLRTAIGDTSGLALSPESFMVMPGSTAIVSKGMGSVSYKSEFTPEVAAAIESITAKNSDVIKQVLGLTDKALAGIFAVEEQTQTQAAEAQKQALQQASEMQLGEASVFNKYLPYIILAFLGLLFFKR